MSAYLLILSGLKAFGHGSSRYKGAGNLFTQKFMCFVLPCHNVNPPEKNTDIWQEEDAGSCSYSERNPLTYMKISHL